MIASPPRSSLRTVRSAGTASEYHSFTQILIVFAHDAPRTDDIQQQPAATDQTSELWLVQGLILGSNRQWSPNR